MMAIYLSFSIKNTFSKNVKDFSNFLSISLPPKLSPPLPSKLANKAIVFNSPITFTRFPISILAKFSMNLTIYSRAALYIGHSG